MHNHVNELAARVTAAVNDGMNDPAKVIRGRMLIYGAHAILRARSAEARYKDRTPFFSSPPVGGANKATKIKSI